MNQVQEEGSDAVVTRRIDSPDRDRALSPDGDRAFSPDGDRAFSPDGDRAFAVAEFRDGSAVRICLRGELDMATRSQVENALIRAEESGATVIELDLGGLTFMDSSGVHLALDTRRRSRTKGYSLVLLEGSAAVQRVFELTGTDHLFR
jgi:anti-sigma B factor antagonist